MTRSLITALLALPLALLALAPATALAEDTAGAGVTATHELDDAPPDTGIASLLGPQIGILGPPTALKVGVHFWHTLHERFAFHASTAMTFGGETTWASSHPETPDAHYDSTVGGELQAGLRYVLFALGEAPFETYLRGALAVDLVGGEEFIGYVFGPVAAIGLSYPLMPGLDLVADGELGLGYGQFKAEAGVFAMTFDLLVGAQIAF